MDSAMAKTEQPTQATAGERDAACVPLLPVPPEDDPLGDLGDEFSNHVLLYHGCDLAAYGIWHHDIEPCLFCAPLPPEREPALLLTDETLQAGRVIHFVCCGNCGARGPWGDRESQALQLWNATTRRALTAHTDRKEGA